ncbi:MAG TPA: hypothetical protein VMW49_04910 [Candidatus Dormibacteraeota bacterium]|nr:hypothetical protein [Candidatus Dormibacteraeota bacterium]
MSADPIAEAAGRWRDAEARLYPMIMVRPDLYERSVAAVRETVNGLQRIHSAEALVAAEAQAHELVADALRRLGAPAAELDPALIAGAALSMRKSEIEAAAAHARRTALIAAARGRGDDWVLLNETQERGAREPPSPPYHRLEMRLADGLGLHLFVELDATTARPTYGLETVGLDVTTGEWLGDAALAVTAVHDSPEPWDAEALALRQGRHPSLLEPAPPSPGPAGG